MSNQDSLLQQINDDLYQVSNLLETLQDDRLVDDYEEYFRKLKENEEIVKSGLKERTDKVNNNITSLIKELSSLQSVNNKDKILSDFNIGWYVLCIQEIAGRIHFISSDKYITEITKNKIQASEKEIFQKHLEFKEKIKEYNKNFPKNKILTIEKAKKEIEKRTKKSNYV